MTEIKINRIIIQSKGDESVGIAECKWNVEPFMFVDSEDIDMLKTKLKEAWEYIADDVSIHIEQEGKCIFCNKTKDTIPAPDIYQNWCYECARSDAMADSDAYDYRTNQIETGCF